MHLANICRRQWTRVPALLLCFVGLTCSADPLQWTTRQVSTNLFQLSHVVYGQGRFVAAGGRSDGGAIMTSVDGTNWSLVADGGWGCCPDLVWRLTYGGGRFLAVGHFGGTTVSTNGLDWTYSKVDSVGLYGVAYGGGRYVAVGDATYGNTTNNIFVSTNGSTWSQRSSHTTDKLDLWDVAYGGGRFVAVGAGNYLYTSTAGNNWTRLSFPGGQTISFGNGVFVVPYQFGTNLVSSDGTNWQFSLTGIAQKLGKPSYYSGLFYARAGGSLATSSDGTNWVQHAQPLPGFSPVASDGTRLVVVGYDPVNPGVAYNAFTYLSDPMLAIKAVNAPPFQLVLSGLVGRNYRVDFTDTLVAAGSNFWSSSAPFLLPTNPYTFTDTNQPAANQRFFRAVLLP